MFQLILQKYDSMEVTSIHSDKNSMRVLFVTQSLGKGGAERLVLDIANELNRNYPNVIVKIVPLGPENDYQELCKGLDIEVCDSFVKLSMTGKSQIQISNYERIVDEFKPDVIHSHTYIAELVSRENVRSGIAYFTHVHNDFPEFNSFNSKTFISKVGLTRFFERTRLLKKYKTARNKFITISKSIDKELEAQLPHSMHKDIHLIPNGIDYLKFTHPIRKYESTDLIQLITVGRLFSIKNHAYLIEVTKHLKEIAPNFEWHLNILGIGPEKENLLKLISEYSLNQNITLQGLISNVQDWMAKSHFYLHCAKSEPFGLVIAEAMASSLPVISLDAGGNRDLIKNKINGYILVQDTTPKKFALQILEILNDKEKYESIARNAALTAQNYDIKFCVNNLIELYKEQICSRKSV